jgi:hypothetical protein
VAAGQPTRLWSCGWSVAQAGHVAGRRATLFERSESVCQAAGLPPCRLLVGSLSAGIVQPRELCPVRGGTSAPPWRTIALGSSTRVSATSPVGRAFRVAAAPTLALTILIPCPRCSTSGSISMRTRQVPRWKRRGEQSGRVMLGRASDADDPVRRTLSRFAAGLCRRLRRHSLVGTGQRRTVGPSTRSGRFRAYVAPVVSRARPVGRSPRRRERPRRDPGRTVRNAADGPQRSRPERRRSPRAAPGRGLGWLLTPRTAMTPVAADCASPA